VESCAPILETVGGMPAYCWRRRRAFCCHWSYPLFSWLAMPERYTFLLFVIHNRPGRYVAARSGTLGGALHAHNVRACSISGARDNIDSKP
jgi:hypothetical protein